MLVEQCDEIKHQFDSFRHTKERFYFIENLFVNKFVHWEQIMYQELARPSCSFSYLLVMLIETWYSLTDCNVFFGLFRDDILAFLRSVKG